ncbi:MAG TPA: PPC domain-containing protein [Longimicrobiaceae bacterium]|jgi:hypothetical protein|nr:PPC domain-containing protein [Longimicrobiaceae bacterium]
MRPNKAVRTFPLLAAALVFGACSDAGNLAGPAAVAPVEQPAALASLTCTASTQTRTVRCGTSESGGARAVIVGGQNQYVTLTSTNIQVVADTFAFDVTVRNLIPQPLGTTNGTTLDPAGVRVFFTAGPTSTAAGTVTVANPDGTGTFTAAGQPYYQYSSMLQQDSVTPVKRWKLRFTPEVASFTFQVYVSAAVQYPAGYVDGTPYVLSLDPAESRALPGVVRSAVGNALPSETVGWSSDTPGTASVSGTQVTAGGARGFATLTASSGARPGIYTTAVSVCQSTVVANGTNLPSTIAASDCFSSYGDPNGRPTNSYYADLYRVTLAAGQTVTVSMDSGDNLDTYLLLANPTFGFLVAGNDDDPSGTLGVGSSMTYTATASGVYVIEASTFNGLDTGSYTLHVTIT